MTSVLCEWIKVSLCLWGLDDNEQVIFLWRYIERGRGERKKGRKRENFYKH